MAKGYKYFNRDLSWLSYDQRVLESAQSEDISIGEALNFVSFHSSNLDEFYAVRVAEYRKAAYSGERIDEVSNPGAILQRINHTVSHQIIEAQQIICDYICPRLLKAGVKLHYGDIPTDKRHTEYMRNYFAREIIPNIQPMLLGKGTLVFLRDNRPYFAVKLHTKKRGKHTQGKSDYSLVQLPLVELPRFLTLPSSGDGLTHIVFIDDVIRANLAELYPGYEVEGAWSIKICRDADLGIRDEFNVNIAQEIRDNLVLRNTGAPSGFYHEADIPHDLLKCLKRHFCFSESEMVTSGHYLNLHDMSRLPIADRGISPADRAPIVPKRLQVTASLFDTIQRGDFMLHFPYQSFDYVIRLLNEAAHDPEVREIKVTQYRVATNSAVVESLISAALANKRVTVFVELKARFDERNNLMMAERMKAAGIKIIYSIPGLKVHAKMALILRGDGYGQSAAYISTGNFNEQTARSYTDHGLFTADPDIIADLRNLFTHLEEMSAGMTSLEPQMTKILVTQINLEEKLTELIDKEIEIAQRGGNACITLKMNGIQYRPLINKLYEASQAGVRIRLIVRGICCIVPDQNYSANISITRLVDTYLEHGRIWSFGPEGDRGIYITSSDWLNRNIRKRIEVAVPILNTAVRQELMQILQLQVDDNVKATRIDKDLNNLPIEIAPDQKRVRSQVVIYDLIAQMQNRLLL